jgi:hypothetical protein
MGGPIKMKPNIVHLSGIRLALVHRKAYVRQALRVKAVGSSDLLHVMTDDQIVVDVHCTAGPTVSTWASRKPINNSAGRVEPGAHSDGLVGPLR